MRHLILIKIDNQQYEKGFRPPPELEAAMGKLMGAWSEKGILLSAEGLKPTSHGARLKLGAGKVRVTDGPFAEAREVIGGFFVVKTSSKEECVALANEFLEIHAQVLGPDFAIECEVRAIDE